MIYRATPLDAMPEPCPRHPAAAANRGMGERSHARVAGDGATDDTAAIRKAIAGHRVLYFPSGRYIIKDTLA